MLFDGEALAALRAAGPLPAELSAFAGQPWLGVNLAETAGAPADLAAWLGRLVCPVIGVGPAGPLAAACDVHLPSSDELPALIARIEENPIAAATFVGLLRASAGQSLEVGLQLESACYASLQAGPEYGRWLAANGQAVVRAGSDEGPAVLQQRRDGVLRLRLNRPATQNAMSVEMRDALVAALAAAAEDPDRSPLHIDARGECFSTGGELSEFGQVPDAASGHLIRLLSVPGKFLAMVADRTRVRVHGACVGSGIEFPAFASHLEARADAWFCLPELGMGLIPGAGGCISIARRIGRQRTAWLGLSGARIDAAQALEWGLVDALLQPGAEPPSW